MFGFVKKLLGLPTEAEKAAAAAPYKVEAPIAAMDIVPQPAIVERAGAIEIPAKPKTAAKSKKAAETKPAKARGRKPKAK